MEYVRISCAVLHLLIAETNPPNPGLDASSSAHASWCTNAGARFPQLIRARARGFPRHFSEIRSEHAKIWRPFYCSHYWDHRWGPQHAWPSFSPRAVVVMETAWKIGNVDTAMTHLTKRQQIQTCNCLSNVIRLLSLIGILGTLVKIEKEKREIRSTRYFTDVLKVNWAFFLLLMKWLTASDNIYLYFLDYS